MKGDEFQFQYAASMPCGDLLLERATFELLHPGCVQIEGRAHSNMNDTPKATIAERTKHGPNVVLAGQICVEGLNLGTQDIILGRVGREMLLCDLLDAFQRSREGIMIVVNRRDAVFPGEQERKDRM